MCRLWVDGLRDQAIILEKVDDHIPLATIAYEVAREMGDKSVVDGQISMPDHEFEVVVGLV